MISLLLVIFPVVLGQLASVPVVNSPHTFIQWNYGDGWNKINYAGPGSDATDLAWRAARIEGINQNGQPLLMPTQVIKAQQKGLHIQLEAVYAEANCVGVNTPGAYNAPNNFEFITNTKCYQKPLGRRFLYLVSEDLSPNAPSHKINVMKVRDVRLYEQVQG